MADETKRVIDQTTDTSLSAGDFVIIDSQSEGTRKFDLGTELTGIKEELQEIIDGGGGSGMTEEFKHALHNILEQLVYISADGQTYLDALDNALWPPADLASISCVYTQSGTVYDTDSLDSLKTDLVVTAHFSDSSTQTVTNYVLSGTLTAGTSVITVSYGGKTTTFNVTVTHQSSGQSDENEWTDGVIYTYTPVTDKYINQNDGTEIAYSHWNATPYLYCEGAAKLTFTATEESAVMANGNMIYNAFYDSNKNYISGFPVTGLAAGVGATCDVSVPATASYFRASGKCQVYNDSNAYATITPKAS